VKTEPAVIYYAYEDTRLGFRKLDSIQTLQAT
jgi:hypothetical protein